MFRAWLELARVSNLPTVWTNVIAGWLLGGGKWEPFPLIWLIIGGSLLYTGGMFLNDAADVKFDREHRTERPIPAGRIALWRAWAAGLAFMTVGFILFVRVADACVWLTSSLAIAILLYDFYHKPWSGSVFIMGSCRTLLMLAAASAAPHTMCWSASHEVIVKSVALGGYIVGVTLIARHESKPAASSRIMFGIGAFGLACPLLAGLTYCVLTEHYIMASFVMYPALVIRHATILMRRGGPSIGRAVGLLLAGIVLVDALTVATADLYAPFAFVAGFPLLLLWQRKIAAT